MRPTIKVRVTQDRLPELLQQLQPRLQTIVSKAAHDVEGHAKTSILAGGKSGRVYGAHQASAPGEAPANDLGNLANGIGVRDGDGPLSRIVAAGADYAMDLEMGTVRMAARPFMTPALEQVRGPFTRAVRKVFDGA